MSLGTNPGRGDQTSQLDQMIDKIEAYLDQCKFQTLSKTNIIVDKETIDDMLEELRTKTPEEIRKYRTMVNNEEVILNDAKRKAHALINEAQEHRNELINEHEVMRQAYEQANEVIKSAAKQAQELLNRATTESNAMKTAAVSYTDRLLSEVEDALNKAVESSEKHMSSLIGELATYQETVRANRRDLQPPQVETATSQETDPPKESKEKDINIM